MRQLFWNTCHDEEHLRGTFLIHYIFNCVFSYSTYLKFTPVQQNLFSLLTVFPAPITHFHACVVFGRSISLVWTYPDPGDAPITHYNIEYNGTTVTSQTSPYRLVNLHPFTSYTIRITAISGLGAGPWSAPLMLTTSQSGDCCDIIKYMRIYITIGNSHHFYNYFLAFLKEIDDYIFRLLNQKMIKYDKIYIAILEYFDIFLDI